MGGVERWMLTHAGEAMCGPSMDYPVVKLPSKKRQTIWWNAWTAPLIRGARTLILGPSAKSQG